MLPGVILDSLATLHNTRNPNTQVQSQHKYNAPAIDAAALEQALAALGKWLQPLPGTFLLRSGKSLADVRAALANALPEDAQAFVLQARDAQLTGIGFDQDLAETARPVWNAPLS